MQCYDVRRFTPLYYSHNSLKNIFTVSWVYLENIQLFFCFSHAYCSNCILTLNTTSIIALSFRKLLSTTILI